VITSYIIRQSSVAKLRGDDGNAPLRKYALYSPDTPLHRHTLPNLPSFTKRQVEAAAMLFIDA